MYFLLGGGFFRRLFQLNRMKKNRTTQDSPVSDDAMSRLAQIMNDSPTLLKLKGTQWEIRGLKPGTQWLIAEEACKITNEENLSMGDVLREFAKNAPSVARVVTLALLNDKKRIYSDEYNRVYDLLMWGDIDMQDWASILFEVLNLIDVAFFFATTNAIQTIRKTTLDRKKTIQGAG